MKPMKNICLVTEEIIPLEGAGGIGTAFSELAYFLVQSSYSVNILYCPLEIMTDGEKKLAVRDFAEQGINLFVLDERKYFLGPRSPEMRSYAAYQMLKNHSFDLIHFHDYKGLGFYSISAKYQDTAFGDTVMVLQLHGSQVWLQDISSSLVISEEQQKFDFMEKESVRKADFVISPSECMLKFLSNKGFSLTEAKTLVLKNLMSDKDLPLKVTGKKLAINNLMANEIIFFGRLNNIKGLQNFCKAISLLNGYLHKNNICVTFLGSLCSVDNIPSLGFLANEGINWKFPLKILSDYDRKQAIEYLASNEQSVVVIPSVESFSYTLLEALSLNKSIITSEEGAARENIAKESHAKSLCDVSDPIALKNAILDVISEPLNSTSSAYDIESVKQDWLDFHHQAIAGHKRKVIKPHCDPKVTIGITHFERPEKLIDALISAVNQTYENIEIIICDDGSSSEHSKKSLHFIKKYTDSIGAKLILQDNRYLGAARNSIIGQATGEYIVFLDDDDLAKKNLIKKTLNVAIATGADVVAFPPENLNASFRHQGLANAVNYSKRISYLPIGGPVALAVTQNVLASATALIKMDTLKKIGGYSEQKNVGLEDYELYFRIVQSGGHIEPIPESLFLYEVGIPSMSTTTSQSKGYKRLYHAIDKELIGEKLKPMLSMIMGQRALTNQQNVNAHVFNDEMKALVSASKKSQSQLDIIQQSIVYAASINSLTVAKALSLSINQELDYGLVEEGHQDVDIISDEMKRSMIDIKIDFAMNEYSSALTKLCSILNCSQPDIESFIMSDKSSVVSDVDMLSFFEKMLISADNVKHLFSYELKMCIYQVLFRSRRLKLIEHFHDDIFDRENCAYLAENQKVKQAVDRGNFNNGWHHYRLFGQREGRGGFDDFICFLGLAQRYGYQDHCFKRID